MDMHIQKKSAESREEQDFSSGTLARHEKNFRIIRRLFATI